MSLADDLLPVLLNWLDDETSKTNHTLHKPATDDLRTNSEYLIGRLKCLEECKQFIVNHFNK